MFLRVFSKRLVALVLDLKISILVEGEFDKSNMYDTLGFQRGADIFGTSSVRRLYFYWYQRRVSLLSQGDWKYSPASSERIEWNFKAKGVIDRKVEVGPKHVYFGSNDGKVYCLDKSSGKLVWSYEITAVGNKAFRRFSSPLVHEGELFIGGADKNLYCLDASCGKLLLKIEMSDWVGFRPVAQGDYTHVASINGVVAKINYVKENGKVVWERRVGKH